MHFLTPLIGLALIMTTSSPNAAVQEKAMTTTIVNSDTLFNPAPYGFSHAVVAENVQKIAYIAGQGGEDKNGKLDSNFANQVKQAYKNLKIAIESTNAETKHVTKLTTYVVNYEPTMLDVMTQELVAVFGEHLPAQTLVPVPRLALDGMLFEVDAVVVIENN